MRIDDHIKKNLNRQTDRFVLIFSFALFKISLKTATFFRITNRSPSVSRNTFHTLVHGPTIGSLLRYRLRELIDEILETTRKKFSESREVTLDQQLPHANAYVGVAQLNHNPHNRSTTRLSVEQ